jgi:hypothetical protein
VSELTPEPVEQTGETGDAGTEQQPWAPSQDEWNQVTQAVTVLAQLEQQRAQVYQPQQQQQAEFDPFDANSVRNLVQNEMAPYQQFQVETQLAEAEEYALDILSNLASQHGDVNLELARLRADALLPAMNAQYGQTSRAAEAALERAYQEQKQYEEKQYSDAVSKYSNQIATLAGAPGEPGSTYTVGVQQRTMPDYRQGGRVTDRFFGANRET